MVIAVRKASTSQQCAITAVLPDGQFTAQGIARYSNTGGAGRVHYGITGGTRAHRTARGQVTVTPIEQGSDRIVVDLVTGR